MITSKITYYIIDATIYMYTLFTVHMRRIGSRDLRPTNRCLALKCDFDCPSGYRRAMRNGCKICKCIPDSCKVSIYIYIYIYIYISNEEYPLCNNWLRDIWYSHLSINCNVFRY